MPFVKIRTPRTSQPQDFCGLDRENPLYRHLSRVLVPTGLKYKDLISGETFNNTSDTSFTVDINPGGKGRRTNSTTLNAVTPVTQLQETISNVGYIWTGVLYTAGGVSYPFVRNNQFSVSVSSSSSPVYLCRAGSTTNRQGTTPVLIKKPTTFGFGKKGNDYTLVVDGKVELSGSDTGTSALTTWAIDSNSGFAQSNDIVTNLALILKSGDASVLKSLVDNPWQVFEPEETLIWISDITSGGYTLSLDSSVFNLTPLQQSITRLSSLGYSGFGLQSASLDSSGSATIGIEASVFSVTGESTGSKQTISLSASSVTTSTGDVNYTMVGDNELSSSFFNISPKQIDIPFVLSINDSINGIIYRKLRYNGYEGSINDMLCTFFGGTGPIVDRERGWLISLTGVSQGSNQDLWKTYLLGLGYAGSLPDMIKTYWINY